MSLFSRLVERRSETTNLSNPSAWLVDWFGGGASASGVRVNPDRALRIVAVYACVRILAETIGALPLHLYRRLPNGGKERATDHPLYSLLHDSPNAEMTSMEFRETCMGHTGLRGNSQAQIVYGGNGRPVELVPLHPDRIRPERDLRSGRIVYPYNPEGGGAQRIFAADEILHIRGLGCNGIVGYNPITLAREALGVSIATEEHGARFFANGVSTTGIVSVENVMSDQAFARFKNTFSEAQAGLKNAGKPIILEEGAKWQSLGIKHDDAQFLETRKFQISEIARLFRVPPHMIADLDKATFSNIEHQGLEFVIHTMLPWLVRHEQRYNLQLLLPSERGEYFFELNIDALLRGDLKSRYEAYQLGRGNGWLSPNDIREMENQNPIEGGDTYVTQSQYVPLDMLGKPLSAPTTQKSGDVRSILAPALAAACQRAARREAKALAALGKRGLPVADLAQFYAEHRTYLAETLGPIFEGAGALPSVAPLAEALCSESHRLAEATRSAPDTLPSLLTALETTRAESTTTRALALLPS